MVPPRFTSPSASTRLPEPARGCYILLSLLLVTTHADVGDVIVNNGTVRVQALSPTLVRVESRGPNGFEDRTTFMVQNRDFQHTRTSINVLNTTAEGTLVGTSSYNVFIANGIKPAPFIVTSVSSGALLFNSSQKPSSGGVEPAECAKLNKTQCLVSQCFWDKDANDCTTFTRKKNLLFW